ncbi:hypothetical protein GCM10023194_51780 [Planotetraspora phitsanulokensis]|uniref:Uncharacterized protein n=1 Tax=Planotetraspora phitsanulokensis TaxID=575192 RepID=A0A8J3UJB0_9ACTN|nr:CU044_5270 family protein [Planotetraspora phitsanulokensis]GII39840.1 hypothetical protein Pph01_48430 [Planotetraspora phitsanulokensis]
MKNDELNSVIDALKPVMVDELADAAYERRPDIGLVRARAGTSSPHSSQVREYRPARRLAFAAGATAVVTAAVVMAVGVLFGGNPGTRDDSAARNGTVRGSEAIDSRAFLLASAETAARQPATHGTCWYTRTRVWVDFMPFKPGPGVPTPADKRFRWTFQARTASSIEEWQCTLPGGTGMRFRAHGPLDIELTFPTKKDKAAWRAAGSRPLGVNGGTTASKPITTTYDRDSHLVNPQIGSHEIEWKTIPKLPATRNGLEAYLRKLWQEDVKNRVGGCAASTDFGEYVYFSAWGLFMAPTTPGTRAALYQILADSPSVKVTGQITDRQGRTGMAISAYCATDGTTSRLVVDPATAQILDKEVLPGGPPGTPAEHSTGDYVSLERQGWVNRIGAVPKD